VCHFGPLFRYVSFHRLGELAIPLDGGRGDAVLLGEDIAGMQLRIILI